MASKDGDYDIDLENRVLKIINKIKKDRNRACLQGIHARLERGGRVIEKSNLRVFLDNLIKKELVVNIAKDKEDCDKESFIVAGELSDDIYKDSGDCSNISVENTFEETLHSIIAQEVESAMKF